MTIEFPEACQVSQPAVIDPAFARSTANLAPASKGRIMVSKRNGDQEPLNLKRLEKTVHNACNGLARVRPERIISDVQKNLYDQISTKDINTWLVISARMLMEQDPNYNYVASRLLLNQIKSEALTLLDIPTLGSMKEQYAQALPRYIETATALDLVPPELATFNLEQIIEAIVPERDLQFSYWGLQTLYDRHLFKSKAMCFELPQIFFMRISMELTLQHQQKEQRAIEFYNLLYKNANRGH